MPRRTRPLPLAVTKGGAVTPRRGGPGLVRRGRKTVLAATSFSATKDVTSPSVATACLWPTKKMMGCSIIATLAARGILFFPTVDPTVMINPAATELLPGTLFRVQASRFARRVLQGSKARSLTVTTPISLERRFLHPLTAWLRLPISRLAALAAASVAMAKCVAGALPSIPWGLGAALLGQGHKAAFCG
jgi:hypothetical protein